MQKFLTLLMVLLLLAPATVMAATVDQLQQQLDELSSRLDKAERKVATDRISFYGDLRVKADSTKQKVTVAQGMMTTAGFFALPKAEFDETNALLYTTRLRLGMKAHIADNMEFMGRLNMYKNWGDSTGAKVMDSWNAFTMDGTDGGNTNGDFLRVERAFFVWKDIADSPFYLSIGRRPSTYGAPANYRENELRGGTPSGHLVNFNFDGITIGYHLSDLTEVEGQTLRFCYGQGYESQYGNGTLYRETDVKDTHLGGFNFDVWNTDASWLQMTLFGVKDVSDGFKGLAVMPMGLAADGSNPLGYISRLQASTNIGDMILAGVGGGVSLMNGMNFFGSFGYTRTIANNNFNGMGFGGLLSDAAPIYDAATGAPTGNYAQDGVGKDHNGYSVYVGMQIPAPMGKLGLEYNYGSEYWIPFTQAQDDVLGSKLATRGHVGEVYYIFDINPRAFIKLGALYYDYQYTGSGSPVGKPQKVADVKDGKAYSAFPVVDTAVDVNLSMTVKF
ncbi:DUF3373 family protein [Geopsychrobacter electrodiphilus]|uniref:DUF3373 family protein n=1 Tax=Geopsychrobacter electrodiphilus TaxID=225196 RepID=UPI00037A4DB1|nr:DUF3373 family protein [Geopsychrobacter electrodiphilus]